jgi:DNA-binding NtrC family response regulator
LKRAGYDVREAANPDEAKAVFAATSEPIALMVTDMVMPGGRGNELFASLESQHPDLKVVFMSGYTTGTIFDTQPLRAGQAFLQKPFTAEALLSKVREVLALP